MLVSKVTSLENTVKDLSGKIVILEEIIKTKTSESNLSSNPSYKCEQCGYKASTQSVLKRHVMTKHKKIIPTPEKEREREHDTSLQLLVNLEERAEALFCPPPPVDTDLTYTSNSQQLNCEHCKHESNSEAALNGHKYLKHDKKYSTHITLGSKQVSYLQYCIHSNRRLQVSYDKTAWV